MMLTVEERLARCHQGTAWMGSLIKQQLTELADLLAASEQSDAESIAMYRKARDERDSLRGKVAHMEKRLRLILEEPENTMSNSKAMREMVRQARLALGEKK